MVKLKLFNKPLKVNVNIFEFTCADVAASRPSGLLLWSFTCHASKSELEGFISNCKPVAGSQTHQLKHGVVPSEEPMPSTAWQGGRSPGSGGLSWHIPCTQKHTQVHTTVLSLLAWIQADPPLQVTCLTHAGVGNVPCYGLGQLGGLQDISALCQAVMLGRAAQTLDCFESKFLNPAQLFNKALLGSTGVLPWWSLYIYICISLCDCIYTFMHKYVCMCMCVCSLGRCIKKIFYLMK